MFVNVFRRWAAVGLAIFVLVLPSSRALALPGDVELVSVTMYGYETHMSSQSPSISANGRYVSFSSDSPDIVVGDTNDVYDIFVRDRQAQTNLRVSVDGEGNEANQVSAVSVLSADGQWIAFQSSASNLVDGDTNGTLDVFLRNLTTGTITLVSVNNDGEQGNGESTFPAISGDGRFVVFCSEATNLTADDTNGVMDIFVRDTWLGKTTCVSCLPDGQVPAYGSGHGRISDDGRYVVFMTYDLLPEDTNGVGDVYRYDRATGSLELISVGLDGALADNHSSEADISGDGRWVVFSSAASNLVAAGECPVWCVYLRDMKNGTTHRISRTLEGEPFNATNASLSYNGRFIAFWTKSALVPEDTNTSEDIYVLDTQRELFSLVTITADGTLSDGVIGGFSISGDGRFVVFASNARNLVPDHIGSRVDVFVKELSWPPPPLTYVYLPTIHVAK